MLKRYQSRRQFLKAAGLGAASLAVSGPLLADKKPKDKPNVILYVVDDHGTDDASCYGNNAIKTPGLDTLASEGTLFTHGFCTSASCSASRSVILTGKYNHATGQYGHQHNYHHFVSFPTIKSLPVLLANAGYRTMSMGKYHVAPEEVYRFGRYSNVSSPVQMADDCREFISAEQSKPFFLYFCTTEPHRPFKREGFDTFKSEDVIVPPYLPDTPQCREELAQYYGSVQRADSGLVRLIEILKESGRWEDTMIIYISDNGIAFAGAKTTLYEPGMRLPCVVRNPYAKKKGIVTNAMVTWADITPTILDFAGAPGKKTDFHGRSFLEVLEEEKPKGWDEIYASHTFHEITMYYPMRVVRTRKYKLIWNIAYGLDYPFSSDLWASRTWQDILKRDEKVYGKRSVEAYIHRPKFELYDLENDPHEIRNLAEKLKYVKVLKKLKDKLKAFQKRTDDPWIRKWEYE
ncbi:MAG: sulfatase family protein [Planctomycetota bacterium]|jgi:N-sulfoglucosamine sulfohydrolase